MKQKPVTLLIVEDDEIDLMGIKRAVKDLEIPNNLIHAIDGVEALEYLRGSNGRKKIKSPYLIVMDINMPRMNGIELLTEIRNDKELRSAIVFVLTTSSADRDILDAYDRNVAGYIVKSDAMESFFKTAKLLELYRSIVALPNK